MKWIILITIFLLTLNLVNASCDNIRMEVIEVIKNDTCYELFSATFQDVGCTYNCFDDISNFIVKQGETILTNQTNIITTYLGVSFRTLDCSEQTITMIATSENGSIYCKKEFNLENELTQWIHYISQDENTSTIPDEDLEEILSNKLLDEKQDDEEGDTGSGTGGGMGGGDLPNEPNPDMVLTPNNPDNTLSQDETSTQNNNFAVAQESNALEKSTSNNKKENITNYIIYIIPILILIILIQIVVLKLIKKKK